MRHDSLYTPSRLISYIVIISMMFVCMFYCFLTYDPFQTSSTIYIQKNNNRYMTLCETRGFSNPSLTLNIKGLSQMNNTSYTFLPLDKLNSTDGSHNGKDYIAYSFYLRNDADIDFNYNLSAVIKEKSKGIEKAIRVMLYQDEKPLIYGYKQENIYPINTIPFLDNDTIFSLNESFSSHDVKHYSIVVWLEGEDPDCVDDILGGKFSCEIVYKVI